ncbi:DEAD/DEAH box helicase [Streptomyces shenzhenensis]|uniref:DEAD/DEAH box helicase n=1 Tax=Streptomyces shenzhenensis TaxID=943815 RepID=UPI001F3BB29B|nr:DEAD/DEAH box helicase [Streptomyces shenzhenensis]
MPEFSTPLREQEAAGGHGRGTPLPIPRPLFWLKTTDPQESLPELEPGTDARVVVPQDARFDALRQELATRGIPVLSIRYWVENEVITGSTAPEGDDHLAVVSTVASPLRYQARGPVRRSTAEAGAARDAFEALWRAQAREGTSREPEPVEDVVPASWAPFLPHVALNPAQSQVAPDLLTGGDNLLVVAPTGAGKTTLGMLAALRAVLGEGRKAAWLVPQRSLTDELDAEMASWRERGLRVVRLSGEQNTDIQLVREADLWVTTTEKFEVLSRTSSLRDTLAEVGCLIVDEIHLLGDPERGSVLEALLTRVRGSESAVRMVGLSATVSNAEQVAHWLGARLVRVAWRPSRLNWQLAVVPASADRAVVQAARTRMTNAITDMVTADHGSVLVFCGSKQSVRRTALALAASRGADTQGIRADDDQQLHRVTWAAGIGLHYKDWEHKRVTEQAFRSRELDVLVATSTVAAGVNLPARAVVVRDTQIGRRTIDVATVQQMFGRAGRVGAGEREGWAFLIADESERAYWRDRLVGGYTVDSQMASNLPDHLLAEVVQLRVRTRADAEQWWLGTFAHHQGRHSAELLDRAVNFLAGADYLRVVERDDGRVVIRPTELGVLTARVMVPTHVGFQLRMALAGTAVPKDADEAESRMADVISAVVPKFARATVAEHLKPAVAALLWAGGRLRQIDDAEMDAYPVGAVESGPGDLARASLLAVANSPRAFALPRRTFASIPHSVMFPVLEDVPRYLHWLGAQGALATIHPWAAIVAADLGRRVRWRRLTPARGSGRLLWMCEQMTTSAYADQDVPMMWTAARERGLTDPDWTSGARPRGCRKDEASYGMLLRERVTGRDMSTQPDGRVVCRAEGRVVVHWHGGAHEVPTAQSGEFAFRLPEGEADPTGTGQAGVAVFSRWGDFRATGWLAHYSGAARSHEDDAQE